MTEIKLINLAELVHYMEVGETIDFATGNNEDIDRYGIWCGVKRIAEFENDNPMYIVSRYSGEAEAVLYHINEYDPRIGDFCAKELKYWDYEKHCPIARTEQNWINCCARMLADYLETHCDGVDEIITVDM